MIVEQLSSMVGESGSHILIASAVSSFITLVVTKINNRRGIFRYTIIQNRLALSTSSPIHGDISVKWKGHDVQNLYMVFIDIENTSSKDYDSVKLKVYSDGQTVILTEESSIDDLPEPIPWHPDYASNARAVIAPGAEKPSQEQVNIHSYTREYLVPVFNRGQNLKFNFLCHRSDEQEPSFNVSSLTKGVKIQQDFNPFIVVSKLFGAPILPSILRGFIFSIFTYLVLCMFSENTWLVALIVMIVSLLANLFGALLYRIQKWIGGWISG